MAQKKNQSKIKIYSVKEIISIFSDIDNKIISLHKCSSDDFLSLNDHFKKYYKDAKTVSEGANKIFELMSNKEGSENFMKELDHYSSQLYNYNQSFSNAIDTLKITYESLLRSLELIYIPINNFNQNLMTFKLLRTNLNIDPLFRIENENMENQFDILFLNIKLAYSNLKEKLEKLKIHIDNSQKRLIQIETYYKPKINNILDQVIYSIEFLSDKQKEAIFKFPELTEKTDINTQSIAKIITNLQYHDIIRQKIEHVQQVHKDILTDLSKFEFSDSMNEDDKFNCLIKIKDIANLQASQLLHANKEYQSAIEVITKKLLELGENMTGIATLCNKFLGISMNNENKNHFAEIRNRLSNSTDLKSQLIEANLELKHQIVLINEETTNLIESFVKIKEFSDKLKKYSDTIQTSDSNKDLIFHIISLLEDINNNKIKINELLDDLQNMNTVINTETSIFLSEKNINEKLESLTDDAHSIMNNLNENNEQVYNLLKQNNDLSYKVFDDIKQSVEEVKYYAYFEKVIEEIIDDLNKINSKLNIDQVKLESNPNNLDELKKNYTMKSEHLIHDTISSDGKKGEIDLFEEQKEEDNIELF